MDRASVLCLLLLFCSVSGAELQDNASPERGNVEEQPQHRPPDFNALLHDMSVQLAENRLMIQQLQTLNQERAAKLAKNEAGIQELHDLNQAHVAELRSLKTSAAVAENQVASLRRDRTEAQVAFSASLLASGTGYVGPINAHTTLVFRHVVSNIGNAYNPHTGIFTAPVRGAYHFEYYFAAGRGSASSVMLTKTGRHIVIAWENQLHGWGSSANGATLLLEAGDVVFLRLYQKTRIYDDPDHYSTFSGHLLFPL